MRDDILFVCKVLLIISLYAIIMLSAISVFYRKRKFNNNRIRSKSYQNGSVELEHIVVDEDEEVEDEEEED